MSSVAHPLQTAVPVAETLGPVLVVLLGGGLVGMSIRNMFESIMSEDETAAETDGVAEEPTTDGGSGLMAEEGGGDGDDDLGGLGGLDDDGEDDLGGFDDDGGFGEMDEGGGGDVDELEHRLDEMEAEVGSLSSTVNTVRNENEQISESVQEVEENVRKLLDIYEMVTRGVNPFADDIDAGMAGGGMGDGGFGLFDEGEETADAGDDIDQDIAEADAEGFFDEDLVEDEEDLEAEADVGDVLGDDGDDAGDEDFDDEFEEDFEELDEEESDDGGGGGTSFQDLKEEYESGDAEWADEVDGEFEEDLEDLEDVDEDDSELAEKEDLDGDELDDELADDELFDEVVEDDAPDDSVDDASGDSINDTSEDSVDDSPATESVEEGADGRDAPTEPEPASRATSEAATATSNGEATGDSDGKPYLQTLPDGFAGELLVVEWLEFLVGEAGVRETARAIDYYESIDWIAEPVADDLQDYLAGFDEGGTATLSIDHHTRSLRYIGQLDGGGADSIAFQRMTHGGGSDGIQR